MPDAGEEKDVYVRANAVDRSGELLWAAVFFLDAQVGQYEGDELCDSRPQTIFTGVPSHLSEQYGDLGLSRRCCRTADR